MIPETFRFLLRYKLLIVKSAVPLSLILLIGFAFLLVGFNLQSTIQNYEGRYSLEIFIDNEAEGHLLDSLRQFLKNQPAYDSIEYISQEAALDRMTSVLGEDPTEVLGYNPLPASLIFYPKPEFKSKTYLEVLKKQVEEFEFVEQGVYAGEVLSELEYANGVFTRITAIFLVLVLVAYILLFQMTLNHLWLKYQPTAAKLNLLGLSRSRMRLPFYIWAVISALLNTVLALIILAVVNGLINKYFMELRFFEPQHISAIIILFASISILIAIFKRMKIPKYE